VEKEKIKKHVVQRYKDRTKKSAAHNEKAQKFLPGGDTRSIAYFSPYPVYGIEGRGCRLYDCDGNEYIDFVNNMTVLINGHAHPHVIEAVKKQLEKGTAHGIPLEVQYKLAEHICNRVSSIDSLRYCNSGSEATLFAMRAARAFTKKQKFIKMDGGYHGCHDHVQVNVFPDMSATGMPKSYANQEISSSVINDMLIAPFNDLNAVEQLLAENKGSVAAIILEPILGSGGSISPAKGYIKGLRKLADRYDTLLIFDEIITFRTHEGGWQAIENVKPDLTALGKVIGGGFPVGAFGGRREIMDLFNPINPDAVTHSGTFSGNAITMTAGLANLEIYGQKEIDILNALGDTFTNKMNEQITRAGIPGSYDGIGGIGMLRFTDQKVSNSKEAMMAFPSYMEFLDLVHLEMMNRGVFFMNRGMFILSTPMTELEIDKTVAAFGETLELLKPLANKTGK